MRRDAKAHRAILIEAAARIFARDGYDGPLETILGETGLGRGTLYRHFPNRKALIVAVMALELERLADFVDARIDRPSLLVDFVRRQGQLAISVAPFMMRMSYAEAQTMVAPLAGQMTELLERVVAQAKAHDIVDAGFAADDLLLVNHMLLAARDDDPQREAERFDRVMGIILYGIGCRAQRAVSGTGTGTGTGKATGEVTRSSRDCPSAVVPRPG